uniref:Proteasome activator complex subunit 3 n=1 Tax=Malurus cyaneus samueli TaxID=2593467 RepID=A0A8C5TNR5_9PASS
MISLVFLLLVGPSWPCFTSLFFFPQAEDLVANFFPKKLLELDGFLKEPILNIHDLTQIHSDMNLPVPDPILLTNSHDGLDGPNMKKRKLEDHEETFQGTKVFVMPNGMLKSNQQLVDIIEKVKPEIRLLIEKCNTVKMWVQLLIPRIEDGNNFGVSIQEETVAELRTVESEAASYLDQISRYYITRAKLVSKIAKYPHVEDYRRTVTEIDEKEYISLRLIISELRNQYVSANTRLTLAPCAALDSPGDPAAAPLFFSPEHVHSWQAACLLPTSAAARHTSCCFSTIL